MKQIAKWIQKMPNSDSTIDWSNAADPRVIGAKLLARDPAGEMMTKHPLFYSKAIIFGEKPKKRDLDRDQFGNRYAIGIEG
jgi:hypothetical protein